MSTTIAASGPLGQALALATSRMAELARMAPLGLEEQQEWRELAALSAWLATADIDRPLRFGRLSLDEDLRIANVAGIGIAYLTPTEWALVKRLVRAAPDAVSKADLVRAARDIGDGWAGETNSLRTHVMNINRKLGAPLVLNRWGFGYELARA